MRFVPTFNTIRITFKLLKAHSIVQILINFNVKVNVSPLYQHLCDYHLLKKRYSVEYRFDYVLQRIVSGWDNIL